MRYALIPLSLLFCLCWGCASHNAASLPQLGHDLKAQQEKIEGKGVVLMARPIHTKSDLKTYFDKDLLQYEVLPIHVHVCNKTHGCPVVLNTAGITLQNANGDQVPALNREQVLEAAKKSYGQAAGWAMAFGIFGLIPSAINVSNTNEQIEADYESRYLKSGDLVPGAVTEGLIFYKVPLELDSLDGWKLSLVVVDPTTAESISMVYTLKGSVVPRPPLPSDPNDPDLETEDGQPVS